MAGYRPAMLSFLLGVAVGGMVAWRLSRLLPLPYDQLLAQLQRRGPAELQALVEALRRRWGASPPPGRVERSHDGDAA